MLLPKHARRLGQGSLPEVALRTNRKRYCAALEVEAHRVYGLNRPSRG